MSVTPELALVVGALVLIAAVAAVRLSTRTGLPSLLLYLGLGIVLGEDVLGIPFDDQELAQSVGYTALALILAEGGLTTRWSVVRPALPFAVVLATVGVGGTGGTGGTGVTVTGWSTVSLSLPETVLLTLALTSGTALRTVSEARFCAWVVACWTRGSFHTRRATVAICS